MPRGDRPEVLQQTIQSFIDAGEGAIAGYLRGSSQKLLLAPEFRMMKALEQAQVQNIRTTDVDYDAGISQEDLVVLLQVEAKRFDMTLSFAALVFATMRIFRDDYKLENLPDLSLDNAGPPQFIVTSLRTYHFRNRDIGRDHQLDESEILQEHHDAMRKQVVLLQERKSRFESLPADIRDANIKWQEQIDGLLQKSRVWHKELVWGKAALLHAAESPRKIDLKYLRKRLRRTYLG
ncbi:MAG: hypothetical protein Q9169_004263 [Polycauliona sp. 2 TL-2023]